MQSRPQAFMRLSRDSERLGSQHDSPRRISTGDVTFDVPQARLETRLICMVSLRTSLTTKKGK